jgi:hypothetical protein
LRALPPLWRVVHWVIIANLLVEIAYGTYMVFVVLAPTGPGPLFEEARNLPFEEMMVRRQYALETWLAIVGLSLYLGLTEVLPRRLGRGDREPAG